MSYNGSGTFNINTAGQPVVTGTTITSTAFNLLTADLATGLSTALTKDGQTTPTANIPLGGFKITGLGAGTAATDAAQYGQLQAGATTIATVTGTDTYVGTLTPAIAAYATGNLFSFVAPNTNTGAATINLNSLGAKNITKLGSTALAAGDIVSGRVYQIEYDGTRFQLLNPSASTVASFSAGSTGFTPSSATTGAVTLAGTLATTNGGTGLTSFTSGGIVYASSTSALATGSALTFDGTYANLTLTSGTSANGFLQFSNSADGGTQGYIGDSKALISGGANSSLAVRGESNILFGIASAEQMRLNSTGLGIGTSSPAGKLDIRSSGLSGTDKVIFQITDNVNTTFQINQTTSYSQIVANNVLTFSNGTTERMRLDSSGNLGLAVTPSAWNTLKAFQINQSSLASYANNTYLMNNVFYDGTNYKYINTSTAARYDLSNNTHIWYNAPSGTAGNAITFTQAMTLDASGNLGIGTTSPATRLNVSSTGNGNRALFDDTTNDNTLGIYSDSTDIRLLSLNNSRGSYKRLGFQSNVIVFSASNGSESARIDTSGNLLVGATSSAYTNADCAFLLPTVGGGQAVIQHKNTSSSGSSFVDMIYNAGRIGNITQNGTTGVLYNLTSDYRLKNNPQALTGAKEFVMALQPKKWQWWDGSGEGVGFIAHEFMEVAKHSGNGEKDAVDSKGNPIMQSIQPSSSEVMANLVSLVQEQQAIIESLKARLDAANL
jgi:hypothetical protein